MSVPSWHRGLKLARGMPAGMSICPVPGTLLPSELRRERDKRQRMYSCAPKSGIKNYLELRVVKNMRCMTESSFNFFLKKQKQQQHHHRISILATVLASDSKENPNSYLAYHVGKISYSLIERNNRKNHRVK